MYTYGMWFTSWYGSWRLLTAIVRLKWSGSEISWSFVGDVFCCWNLSGGTVNFIFCCSLSRNESTNSEKQPVTETEKNESESYDIAVYIGILSFMLDVPCQWVRIFDWWNPFLGIHFLISQILIMKSAPLTVQVLVLLLPFGKIGWKLFTLSIFCLRIDQNSKGVVKERGMISKWKLVRKCYLCVMCGSFLFL